MSDYQEPNSPSSSPPPVPPVQPPRAPQPPPTQPRSIPQHKRTSGKAIVSFLLGLAGMVMWVFAGLPALLFGISAKSDIKHDDSLTGTGLANFGIFLSIASFFVAPILMFMVLLGAMMGSVDQDMYVESDERIVHIHLAGVLTEAPVEDPFAVFGTQPGSFRHLLHTLEHIEDDETVMALVITLNGFFPSMAHMEEIHQAIQLVEESGTNVYVHVEDAMLPMPTYVMLSGASYINVVPTGFMNLSGLYSEGMYLRDGLEKIGLKADIVHIGNYKSAGETMMRSGPSKEAEEAMNWLLDSLYESNVNMIADSRDLNPKVVRAMLDEGPYTAELAEKKNLIDSCMYQDDLLDMLKDEYGEDIYIENHYNHGQGSVSSVSPFERLMEELSSSSSSGGSGRKAVGVVYVEGSIMPGYGAGAFSGNVRNALEEAADDPKVKAVVMRVNSPGGSVTASEVIWRAAEMLKDKKPLVVSMGSLAASGGYYIACGADSIYADKTTITGSIGVVGGKIVTTEMWDELGINWHPYQRGANADWMSSAAPFNHFQRQQITEQMGEAYVTFKEHVVAGRGDKLQKDIEDIAAGRVFTGVQAKELGLVDEIGGLEDAIEHAAELADIKGNYRVRTIPRIKTFGEQLDELFGGGTGERPTDLDLDVETPSPYSIEAIHQGLTASREGTPLMNVLHTLEPERTLEMYRMIQCAELLNSEGVMVMMPIMPVIGR